ncbi:UPF0665 family protein c [Stagonosporopsis vannaccii]|nr:UPF0665 family protein c [Stagonosporopsis vannaccii]
MRYIRFLKTPRLTSEKGTKRTQVYCLITITSDLGDSTLPYDADLVAELISPARDFQGDEVLVERAIKWTAGLRTLPVTLPLKTWHAAGPLRMRIGTKPKASHDTFDELSQVESQGIVSAWSAPFDSAGQKEAIKLVERRFSIAHRTIRIWEETGESIARHLWDAGIALSSQLSALATPTPTPDSLSTALSLPSRPPNARLTILELGTGCGIVGTTFASLIPNCHVTLTDLPEVHDIVARNTSSEVVELATGSRLSFEELDWDAELPAWLADSQNTKLDLVLAADCTYNSDSSPALVNTLKRLAAVHSNLVVAIAMKMRHDSERVFFHLMDDAGFEETALLEWPLPGDVAPGEEKVYLHVYRCAA